MKDVIIIGGGITGLATAFYLQEASQRDGQPIRYTLLEAGPRLGGKIVTRTDNDLIIEGGPDSFVTYKPAAIHLCRDLGIEERLIPCNSHHQTVSLLLRKRLVPLPTGMRLTVPTRIGSFIRTPLLSFRGKARMLRESWVPVRTEKGDESLADFIRRRFGAEALHTIAAPLMAGIYVADPERLSMQATFPKLLEMERTQGSLIRTMRKRQAGADHQGPLFMSLQKGLGEMIGTLQERLTGDIRTGCWVTKVQYENKEYHLSLGDGSAPLRTQALVLAVPAYTAAELLSGFAPEVAQPLKDIRYVSTATVSLVYERDKTSFGQEPQGFGFVVPKDESELLLACTWSSSKFPNRAPTGKILIRAFVGGAGKEDAVERSDEELAQAVRNELSSILAIRDAPSDTCIFRWIKGNPQYDVGHLDRIERIEQQAASVPGLYLAGSAYRGVGIPDCIQNAKDIAGKALMPKQNNAMDTHIR